MSPRSLAPLLLAPALLSCQTPAPRLTVELSERPVASRMVVDGNCFAGWFLGLPLRLRGQDVSLVALESINVGVEDARSGRLLGQEDLALDVQFASGDGEQSLDVPVSVRIAGDVREPTLDGAVIVRGEARARDAGGSLSVPFRLDTVPAVADVPIPRAGACTAPP